MCRETASVMADVPRAEVILSDLSFREWWITRIVAPVATLTLVKKSSGARASEEFSPSSRYSRHDAKNESIITSPSLAVAARRTNSACASGLASDHDGREYNRKSASGRIPRRW